MAILRLKDKTTETIKYAVPLLSIKLVHEHYYFISLRQLKQKIIVKRVIVSVINDLVTDRRVDKVCRFLDELGFDVLLVGRKKTDSLPLEERPYPCHRMKLLFENGPFFYAEFNLRLFFFLLFRKAGLLLSNDLDTLLPNSLISRLKNIPLVYDSHELFTQTPEVIHRKFVQNTWKLIERCIVPELRDAYTVNASIARIFGFLYGTEFKVVRNIPEKINLVNPASRKELGLPLDKKIILMQGAGINVQRGAEELVRSMSYLDDSYLLLIIGGGDVMGELKKIASEELAGGRVIFKPKMPFKKLQNYTIKADLGVSIDKDSNLNYRYSLPNKLFDYIHAQIPVLISDLPEIKRLVVKYRIGEVIEKHSPEEIASKIREMLSDGQKLTEWRENLKFASEELNWENEKNVLRGIYQKYV